jgi:hypothetical protein
MALKIIKYEPFKRGDTPVFAFTFTQPATGFNWATVTIDGAITAVEAPNDNTGASVSRLNQTLTVDASNTASFNMQPIVAESRALTAGGTYRVEVQLKDNGGTNVATAVTGQVTILQDYVI